MPVWRTGVHGVVFVGALLLIGACAESTAPATSTPMLRYTPAKTPEPAIGSFHVVLTTTGVNPDPDGYALVVDDSITEPTQANDTVFVTKVVLGSHRIRLRGVATNCVPDSASSLPLFLASARDTVLRISVDCVGAATPAALTGVQMLFVRAGQIVRTTIGGTAAPSILAAGDEPTWSPDGERIAFVRNGDVYVIDANGANERLIATGLPVAVASPQMNGFQIPLVDLERHAVAWSPDGSRLALYSEGGIVIAPVDTTGVVRLDRRGSVPYGELSGSPTWSPDGKRVAFVSDSWIETLDVFVGDVTGSGLSNVRKLTGASSAVATMYLQPAWSPDGRRIAMTACAQPANYYTDPCAGSRIVVMNADGSQRQTLAYSRGFARPAWSPDGQTIAFANTCAEHDCASAVLYVSADGTQKGVLMDDAYAAALWR